MYLIENGLEVNFANKELITPLQAAFAGHRDSVILALIDVGANLYVLDEEGSILGNELMWYGAETDDAPLIKKLIEKGISTEIEGPQGNTPLMLAVADNKADAARALLENGANAKKTLPDKKGTPRNLLLYAIAGDIYERSAHDPFALAKVFITVAQMGVNQTLSSSDINSAFAFAKKIEDAAAPADKAKVKKFIEFLIQHGARE